MIKFEPKFSDCTDCKHYRPHWPNRLCRECDRGELFETKINDDPPTDDELMRIYARMDKDDD